MLGELGLEEMSPHPIPALSDNNLDVLSTTGNKKTRTSGCVGTNMVVPDSKYEDTLDLTNDLKIAAEKCQLLAVRLQKKGEEKLRNLAVDEKKKMASKKPSWKIILRSDDMCTCINEGGAPDVKGVETQTSTTTTTSTNGEENHDKVVVSDKIEEKELSAMQENIRLRQDIKDVTDINKRWQKYNKMQQSYVQKLLGEIRKLKEEKSQMEVEAMLRRGSRSRNNEEPETSAAKKMPKPLTFRHSDSSLIDNNAVVAALRQSYENAVKENYRLESELDELKQREACRVAEMDKLAKLHAEQLDLLAYQLKSHKEDWEAEKAEKEEEKNKNQKLREELEQLRIKYRNYAERLSLIEQTCRCTSTSIDCEFVPSLNEFPSSNHHHNHLRSLRRHQSFSPTRNGRRASFICDGPLGPYSSSKGLPEDQPIMLTRGAGATANNSKSNNDIVGNALKDTTTTQQHPVMVEKEDSFQLVDLRSTTNPGAPFSITKDAVECPGCLKEFPAEQHLNFLDHFEECQTDRN